MTRLLLVCAGGALGSGARYLVSLLGVALLGVTFPWGTLAVNVAGSFLIAAVMELLPPTELRLFLVTGVLGGFTTYSSFNQETLELMHAGEAGTALLNVAGTVAGCLIAGFAGILLIRLLR